MLADKAEAVACTFVRSYYRDLVEADTALLTRYYNEHSSLSYATEGNQRATLIVGRNSIGDFFDTLRSTLGGGKKFAVQVRNVDYVAGRDCVSVTCSGTVLSFLKNRVFTQTFILNPTPYRENAYYISGETLRYISVNDEEVPANHIVVSQSELDAINAQAAQAAAHVSDVEDVVVDAPVRATPAKKREPKTAEPKAELKAAEPKTDAKPTAERAPRKEREPRERKERKAAEPKAAEPKAAEPKTAEPKAAEPKTDAKPVAERAPRKEREPRERKERKPVEPKTAEPKAAEPKTDAKPVAERAPRQPRQTTNKVRIVAIPSDIKLDTIKKDAADIGALVTVKAEGKDVIIEFAESRAAGAMARLNKKYKATDKLPGLTIKFEF